MVSLLPARRRVTFEEAGPLMLEQLPLGSCAPPHPSCPDRCQLTQHTDAQHEGVHPIRHHPRAPPGRAGGGHHLLGLRFLALHLFSRGEENYRTLVSMLCRCKSGKSSPRTILLLISWKWISHTFSTTSSFSNVTKPNPDEQKASL